MPVTDGYIIPPDEEMTVQEITISSPVLRAAATYLGKYCDEKCKEYELCRVEEADPRKCLGEGKEVTACGIEFFQKVKNTCADELTTFAKCIDWNSWNMNFEYCRKEQAIWNACMFEKLGQRKPDFGHFAQLRLHESKRPRPAPFVPEFPDKTDEQQKDVKHDHAIGGSRFAFYP